MKTSSKCPDWAVELVEQVCKDYNRAKPADLTWTQSHESVRSGGTTYYHRTKSGKPIMKRKKSGKYVVFRGRIHISAGTSVEDQKLVLLHELAHWIVVRGKAVGHTVRFWKKAYELYERYGVNMEYAFEREKTYKAKAVQVYERHYQ